MKIQCESCQSEYPDDGMPYRCPSCGGLYDFDGPFPINSTNLVASGTSLWQYQDSFGLPMDRIPVSMGEGKTPLLLRQWQGIQLGFKMESYNPSGSYKDRGTTLLATELQARGISAVVEDSSGNAGASLATYCSWADIDCRIFVPTSASGAKISQIRRSNARLEMVPGARENASLAVVEAVNNEAAVYASHAYSPFTLPGIATIAYELFQSLGKAPGTVLAPVGHGGLFLGIMRGFDALFKQQIISQMPTFVGVQAAGYHPLVTHFHANFRQEIDESIETLAEGVRIQQPSRFNQILAMCDNLNFDFVACTNDELEKALPELWRMGLYVEMTSALVWAAYRKFQRKLPEPIVFILTGSGLKY